MNHLTYQQIPEKRTWELLLQEAVQHTVYTIGYRAPGALEKVTELVNKDVHLLDIRLHPWSRFNPVWNRKQLSQRFGFEHYESLTDLGNINHRFPDRPMQLQDASTGLQWLCIYLAKRDVLLLCACADHTHCHRSLVCQCLREWLPTVRIVHLVAQPTIMPQWNEQLFEEEG